MTLDEAVAHLGRQHVRDILQSGRAFDLMRVASFQGRALTAQLRRDETTRAAYHVLAGTDEALAWQAIRPEDELVKAFKEGSGRAMNELLRRGIPLPVNLAMHGAWL